MLEVNKMPDYKSIYLQLFNRITDAINILQKAQQEGEKAYIESEDTPIIVLDNEHDDKKE